MWCYVGKTIQQLEVKIAQHVLGSIGRHAIGEHSFNTNKKKIGVTSK